MTRVGRATVASVGDSYDNALAETINGLYKAEVIHRRGPWRNFEAVEFATLECVDWFNHRRLLSATFRQPKPKSGTTPSWTNQPWPQNLNEMARQTRCGSVKTSALVLQLFHNCQQIGALRRLGRGMFSPAATVSHVNMA